MAFGQQGAGFQNPEEIVVNEVVIIGNKGFLAAYFPSQAPGDLVASISAQSFADAEGNEIIAYISTYGNNTYPSGPLKELVNLGGTGITWKTGASESSGYSNPISILDNNGTLSFTNQATNGDGGFVFNDFSGAAGAEFAVNLAAVFEALQASSLVVTGNETVDGNLQVDGNTLLQGTLNIPATSGEHVGFDAAGSGVYIQDASGNQWLIGIRSGQMQLIPISGTDGNQYDIARLTSVPTGSPPGDVTINAAGFTPVLTNPATRDLGVGLYKISGTLCFNANAAGGANGAEFQLVGGGGLAATLRVDWNERIATTPYTNGNMFQMVGLSSTYTTAVLSTVANHTVDFSGTINVTTPGTISLEAAVAAAASAFTLRGLGSYFEVEPITA